MTIGEYYETTLWDGKYKLTSKYGPRTKPTVGFHEGWDFGMPVGTKLKAPADGRFTWGTNDGFGGQYGKLQRIDGTWDYFFHCSSPIASNGAVKKGQYICKSGNTGNSTGPHLHWERRRTTASTSHFDDINSILINNTPMDNTILWTFLQKYRPDVCKVYTQANCHEWWAQYGKNEIPVQYDNLFQEKERISALNHITTEANKGLVAENENLKQQVANLSSELTKTKAQLVSRGVELTEAQKKNEEYLGNIEALEGSLQEQKTQCDKDKEELESQVAREENKNKLLKEKNDALETANYSQAQTIKDLETKTENQRVAIVRLEKKLEGCETSMTSAIQTLIKKLSDFIINLLPKKK